MDLIQQFLSGWYALIPFALFFTALALLTRGVSAFGDTLRALPEWKINLAIFAFDILFVLPYVALPSAWLVSQLGIARYSSELWTNAPIWLSCVAAVVVGDYVGYWRHRLEHTRLIWPAHATHHSDRAMSWFSLVRMHPMDRLTTVTIDMTVLALLGFPIWALIANNFIRNAWGYFIHADLRWTLGLVGEVLISPSAHRWHHARDEKLSGKNFATIFTFWDRVHGTYYSRSEPCVADTGVEGHTGGVIFELLHPFKCLGAAIFSTRKFSDRNRSSANQRTRI